MTQLDRYVSLVIFSAVLIIAILAAIVPVKIFVQGRGTARGEPARVSADYRLTIGRWLARQGATVEKGEPVLRVSTEYIEREQQRLSSQLAVAKRQVSQARARYQRITANTQMRIARSRADVKVAESTLEEMQKRRVSQSAELLRQQIETQKIAVKQAREKYNRLKRLADKGAVPRNRAEQAKTNLQQKGSELDRLKLELEQALSGAEVTEEKTRKQTSEEIIEKIKKLAEQQKKVALREVDVNKARVKSLRQQVEQLNERINNPVFKAPKSGVVRLRVPDRQQLPPQMRTQETVRTPETPLPPGAVVRSGAPLFAVFDPKPKRVVANIPEMVFNRFNKGASVRLFWDGRPNDFIDGTIVSKSQYIKDGVVQVVAKANRPLTFGASVRMRVVYYDGPLLGALWVLPDLPAGQWRYSFL